MSDDDKPVEVSIKKFKKRKFVDTLPDNLKEMYYEEKKKVIKPRDPRFDPKVPGTCRPDQIDFLQEKNKLAIKELTEKLKDPNLSNDDKTNCKLLLVNYKQQLHNFNERKMKAKFIESIYSSSIKEIQEGHLPKMLKKKDFKMKLRENMNSKKSKKTIEKSERRKTIKKLKNELKIESQIK